MTRKGRAPVPTTARPALEQVAATSRELHTLEEKVNAYVDRARAEGATWGHVGDALGISPQGAQQRFDRRKETHRSENLNASNGG